MIKKKITRAKGDKRTARDAHIVKLREEGLTYAQITERLGHTKNVISTAVQRAGLGVRRLQLSKWDEARDAKLLEMFEREEPVKAIAYELDERERVVRNRLVALGKGHVIKERREQRKQQARDLRRQGKSFRQIADQMDLSTVTIINWCKQEQQQEPEST
jgi:transposase